MSVSDSEFKNLLMENRSICIVGLSSKIERKSFEVGSYLVEQGYDVDGVHPTEKEVLGRPCYSSLTLVPHPLEIVNVFLASERLPLLFEELIPLGPKVIWLQEGVQYSEGEQRARERGIFTISNRCIMKEHQRLF